MNRIRKSWVAVGLVVLLVAGVVVLFGPATPSTARMSLPTSRTAMASTSATTFASSA
jgi:hypothetical protein